MLVAKRERKVEWGDCDPAKIVYNPRFFDWFDNCTGGLLEAAGFHKKWLFENLDFTGIPLVESRAKFMKPSRFGDIVVIETQATDIRRSSFDIRHRLFNAGELAIEAFETRVWTGRHPDDPSRMKSVPIPDEIVRALKGEAKPA
ncbi:MAG: acyl-CoA thioesterase [Rhodoblastus sp.]|nr:acyl-CoA thioesterase [Rhodoblastus sp.]